MFGNVEKIFGQCVARLENFLGTRRDCKSIFMESKKVLKIQGSNLTFFYNFF